MLEDFYQRIGEAALDAAEGLDGRLVVYAEADDGVVSADLLYDEVDGTVRIKQGPLALRRIMLDFWEHFRETNDKRAWKTMSYVMDGDDIDVEFVYHEDIDNAESALTRRSLTATKYFGEKSVDMSRYRE